MIRRNGGLRRLLDRSFTAIGLRATDAPQRGDVGSVKAPAERHGRIVLREIGAIFAGPGRAAIFTPDAGLLIVEGLPVTAAWRV